MQRTASQSPGFTVCSGENLNNLISFVRIPYLILMWSSVARVIVTEIIVFNNSTSKYCKNYRFKDCHSLDEVGACSLPAGYILSYRAVGAR